MSNIEIIQLQLILLILMIVILSLLTHIGRKRIEDNKTYTIFQAGKKRINGTVFYKLYNFFSTWPLTKRYVHKITMQFEIIMPGDKRHIAENSMKTVLKIWICDLICIILLFALKPSFINAIITITYIYFVNNEVLGGVYSKYNKILALETDKMISNVSNKYNETGSIEDALYNINEVTEHPLKLHTVLYHEFLTDEDVLEKVEKYNEVVPNRFLKLFLSLSTLLVKYGDKKIGKQSLYQTNLKYLKQDLNIDITNRNRINFLFSGLILITILPILALEPIRNWAIQCYESLQDYYSGALGIFTVVIVFVVTIGSYNLINRLKEHNKIEVKKYVILEWLSNLPFVKARLDSILYRNYGRTKEMEKQLRMSGESITPKQFLLKRILYGIITFTLCILMFFFIHGNKKENITSQVNNLDYFSSMISQEQIEVIKETIVLYVTEYKRYDISVEEVKKDIIESVVIKSKEIATLTSEEIVKRINNYQSEYFKWYELLFCYGAAIIAFYIPYIVIVTMRKVRQMAMDDEITQFHSIILMLMHMDNMTIETLLTWFSNFSVIFKQSIQRCLCDLQSGEMEALEKLKDDEPYEPFVMIVERLKLCDKVSVFEAFDDISEERKNYQDNRKLENEIFTTNKVAIAKLFTFAPFIITVAVYLILPFMIEGLSMFFNNLNQMRLY